MDKKIWLRGIAVGLGVTGLSGISYGQNYAPASNNGLAPSSFPMPTTPLYRGNPPPQQMIIGGNNPYYGQNLLAQNEGHIHVPHGNYTAAENVQNALPPNVGSPIMQGVPQSYTAPLPPVYNPPDQNQPIYNQPPVQSSFVQPNPSAAPMYQVPAQYSNAPQTAPTAQVQYMGDPNAPVGSTSSCQQCNQPTGQLWNGYSTSSCAPTYTPSYAPQAVSLNPWIVGGGGLILNRVDNDYVRLSHDTANSGASALSTFDGRMRTSGGFEVFGGRYFGCGQYALIGSYWGLFPGDQSRTIYDPELNTGIGDSIRTNLPFTVLGPGAAPTSLHGIEMPPLVPNNVAGPNGGQNVYDWYDNAYAHRLVRSQNFNNVEMSLFSFGLGGAVRQGVAGCGSGIAQGYQPGWTNGRIGRGGYGVGGASRAGYGSCSSCGSTGSSGCGSCGTTSSCNTCVTPRCSGPTGACAPIIGAQCSRLRFAMLGGVRWFRFNDYMEYATSENDATFGGADDFYYRNTLRNDLLGFQLGGRATYCTGRKINLYGGTKFGVFGNRINYDTFAGTTTTAAVVSSYNSYDNQAYDIHAATTGLSLLGEGELGTGVRVSRGWTANCGYRVIGATGIATAPGQIPYDFSLLNDVRRIHHHDSLVLHGVSFGGMYNW